MLEVKKEDKLIPKVSKFKKDGQTKKTKLRKLATKEIKTDENLKNKTKFNSKYLGIFVTLIAVAASFAFSNISFSSCGFWATYENNFNKLVHGDEKFCYRELDPSETFKELQEKVVGQDDALKLIKGSLSLANQERIIQMAFYGPTGSGKTLSSKIIAKNFKWQQNVIELIHEISFQQNLTGQQAFDSDLKVVETEFSECGFNLLVIDDVDKAMVQRINALERNLHRKVKQKLFKLVMIVIFRGEVKADDLENFVTIEFEAFTEENFHKCIELQQKLSKVRLKPSEIEELKKMNYTSSGCKNVAKKINLCDKN